MAERDRTESVAEKIDISQMKMGRKSLAALGGGSIRNILKRNAPLGEISSKSKKIFQSVDVDGSGLIDAVELRRLLKSWGITGIDQNSLVEMFVQDHDAKRKQKALNIQEFDNFMKFFFTVRNEFDAFPKRTEGSITVTELPKLCAKAGYRLNEDVMAKFLDLFDYDKSGTLEFNEILGLFLYLNRLEFYYDSEDADGSHSLDEKELQSLLRALHINTKIEEVKLLMAELPPGSFMDLSFDNFVELFFIIKNNLPNVKEKANQIRAKNKQKPFKRKVKVAHKDDLKRAVAREQPKLDSIIAHCKSTGKKWSDPEFPPNASSLFKDPKEAHRNKLVTQWKRPHEYAPAPALFVDGVEEGDVIQGRLGNCYLLSAFCVLACQDEMIEHLVVSNYPEYGVYQCRFFKNHKWVIVFVDDQIPMDDNGLIFFGQCRDINEYWVQIVEKAYAKLHGSYGAIEHGVISDALVDLTGDPAELITPIVDTDELWDRLATYMQEGYLMGCTFESDDGSPNAPTDLGLLKNHAYGVLDIQEVDGHKLMRLRNPWGSVEWTGPWSDGSCEWTEELLEHFNFEFGDDGTFFMEFHDFCENYTHFIVLRLLNEKWEKKLFQGRWEGATTGGCVNHPTWMNNPQLRIRAPAARKFFIALSQEDGRLRVHGDYTYPSAGITILRRKDDHNTLHESLESRSEIAAVSKFICTREASVAFQAEPNQSYSLILSTYNPGIESGWYAMVCSLGHAEVVELNQKKPTTNTMRGEWLGTKAGGCCDWTTWRNGTQYHLVVREAGEKTVTLVQSRKQQKLVQIGYYIFPANKEKLPVLDKDTKLHNCQFLDGATISNTYNLDRGLYTILPCTFRPDFETQYGLVVQGTGCELSAMHNDWNKSEVYGQWTAALSGGCGNAGNKDYVKNPIIHFRLGQDSTLYIVLQIEEYSEIKGIGFYLFASDSNGSLGTRLDRSDFKTDKEVVKRFEQPPGDYAILPVTYNKGVQGNWHLMVYSTTSTGNLRQVNK